MISYGPLRALMGRHKITFKELRDNFDLGTNTAAKLNNDTGYVSLEVIDKVCNYLSQQLGRAVTVSEVLEFTPD